MAYTLTAEDRQVAKQLGSRMFQAEQAKRQKKPKDRGNLFTNSLSTVGGIGGGILGSLLAPGAGTMAGGAAGAGLGKILENMMEGNKQDVGEIAGEAALGTLGGIGKGLKAGKLALNTAKAGGGASKALNALRFGEQAANVASVAPKTGILGRLGLNMEKTGNRMLASQSQLTAAQARQAGINPVDVFGSINKRTGLKSMDDMVEVAKDLTGGKDSILDTLTRSAIGSSKGVQVADLRRIAQDTIDNSGALISDSARKQLLNNMTRAGTSMRGGAKGSLTPLADPTKALDQANSFRGTAREITNSFTATPEQKQIAKVYNTVAKQVEDAIYKSPGVNESMPMLKKAVADDLLFQAKDLRAAGSKAQAVAKEKVAKEVLSAESVADIRKIKKDFVDIGKIDTATAQAQGTRNLSGADISQKAGNILRNPMNIVATPLDAATPGIAGLATRAGRALQGRGAISGAPSVRSQAIKSGALQVPAQALTGQYAGGIDPAEQAAYTSMPGSNDVADYFAQTGQIPQDGGLPPTMPGGDILGDLQASQGDSIYSRESAAQDIQADLQATGGKNMDKYMALYEFMNPEVKEPKKKQASVKEYSQAQGGLSGVNQLTQMLQNDPSLLTKGNAPGQDLPFIGGLVSGALGTGEYNATANNVLNSLARLNTGASMPASEESFYRRLLPAAGDSEATRQQKLAQLSQAFEPFMSGY
jgi:hypothetical protein